MKNLKETEFAHCYPSENAVHLCVVHPVECYWFFVVVQKHSNVGITTQLAIMPMYCC